MWRPASEGAQMEERVAEDGKKQRRWKRDGNDDDDEDEGEAGNVDSGFLSGANLQFSGEIAGASGLLHSPTEAGPWHEDREGEGRGGRERRAAGGLAPEATTPSTPLADEGPMRAVDSGVDLDLTETLSQLSLKQVSLNPLAAKGGKLIQAEPTAPELLPVSLARRDEDATLEGRREHDERCATSGEEQPWQLYYAQDDDGDT